jgi:hypothetical protein
MKKAILVLSVLVVMAVLVVPIFAEGLAIEEEPNLEMSPSTIRGTWREAEAPEAEQIARLIWRRPPPSKPFL